MKYINKASVGLMVERRGPKGVSTWYGIEPGKTRDIPDMPGQLILPEGVVKEGTAKPAEESAKEKPKEEAPTEETPAEEAKPEEIKPKETPKETVKPKGFEARKAELEAMKMRKLQKIGKPLGARDNDKSELINEILAKEGY